MGMSHVGIFSSTWRRAGTLLVAGLVTVLTVLVPMQSGGAAAADVLTLHGTVTTTAGQPLPGATVMVSGTRAIANAQGQYRLDLTTVGHTLVEVWASGYSERILSLVAPSGGGDFALNFSGTVGLQLANINPSYGVNVSGLPVKVAPGITALHVHGTSAVPLFATVGVEVPSGFTKLYPLHTSGSAFNATIPLNSNGVYRVEILTASALPAVNTLVFKGMTPAYPVDPSFAPAPAGATMAQLAAYVLGLVNQVRATKGLASLKSQAALTSSATGHTVDMVNHNYFLIHPHTGSDGSTPALRVKRTGFRPKAVSEDVGMATTADMMVVEWLHSPLHLYNILGNSRWAGIGLVKSGNSYYGTIDFAR